MNITQIFKNKNVRFWGLQVCLALFLLFAGIYAVLLSLDGFTRHGEFIVVPDLEHVSLSKAQELLEKSHLRYEVRDSTAYNKEYPPYTVMKQTPEANEKVKKDRKIYLSINPTNFRKIDLPNIIRRPIKEVRPNLASLNIKIGRVTYVNDISKDAVLRAFYKGKEIKPGDKILENSSIDLECGNGLSMNEPDNTTGDNSQEGSGSDNSEGIDF
ncbi:PASTA domain-containing protein [Capnocytophaga granulosa]|jgi:PASTA domain containing protein|uniref:PASTA domain-containing protein n=1 Tax=Capnocytophaga granulosa TaxID=45242 RepID=UPI0036140D28